MSQPSDFTFCAEKTERECKDAKKKCTLEYRADGNGVPICVPNIDRMKGMDLSDLEIDYLKTAISIILPEDSNDLVNSKDFMTSLKQMYNVFKPVIYQRMKKEATSKSGFKTWKTLASSVSKSILNDIMNTVCQVCQEPINISEGLELTTHPLTCCGGITFHTDCLKPWVTGTESTPGHYTCPVNTQQRVNGVTLQPVKEGETKSEEEIRAGYLMQQQALDEQFQDLINIHGHRGPAPYDDPFAAYDLDDPADELRAYRDISADYELRAYLEGVEQEENEHIPPVDVPLSVYIALLGIFALIISAMLGF